MFPSGKKKREPEPQPKTIELRADDTNMERATKAFEVMGVVTLPDDGTLVALASVFAIYRKLDAPEPEKFIS